MSPTWYLGPIGDLRALPCPEPNIEMSVTRYGGTHQGLSGARQTDVTGFRREIPLEFTYLDKDEWAWLEAIHMRLIPGPYYLINPTKKNRLVPESSFPKVGGGTARGSGILGGTAVRVADWPAGVGVGGWASRWFNRAGASWFRFGRNNPAAVNPGEQIVFSTYIKGSAASNVRLLFDYYDRTGQNGASVTSALLPVTTSWTRIQYAVTVPAGIGAVDPVVSAPTNDGDIFLAAGQLELGATATPWELGGGSMKATIDQLPTVSPIFPLTNVSISIQEA